MCSKRYAALEVHGQSRISVAANLSSPGLTVKGAAVGTEEQMVELLQLAITGKIKPMVEVVDFSQTSSVLEKLRADEITGRVVVKIPS
jgi:propanol-preferring alcohol dehydrogenase